MIYAMENTVNGTSGTFCIVEEKISEFEHMPLQTKHKEKKY